MNRRNRVAFFNILSIVLLNGISILTGSLFSRLRGDSGYGYVKIYNIWASVIAIAFTLQTQSTLANARVEYPEGEQDAYASSVMSMSVLAYLACSVVVVLFIRPVSDLLRLEPFLIALLLLQAFGTFCVNFLNTKFVYEFKAGWNMIASLAITITTFVLSVALILYLPEQIRYYGRILAIAATYTIIGLFSCGYVLTKGRTFYRRDYWRMCIAIAVPSVFYNLSDLILGQSDQVMIQHIMGEGAAGRYGLAYTFGNFMFVIYGALSRTWCPFFFEEIKLGKKEALGEKTVNFLELYTVLSVGFILLCTEVYHIYAGPEFWDGTGLIPLFVTSYYLNFLCTFPVNFEYYHKKTKAVATITVVTCGGNILLNYFLIRSMGMAGAAVATVISHGFQLAMHHCYCRWRLGRDSYPFGLGMWWKYLAAYAAMLAFVWLAQDRWLLRWGAGAALGLWELYRIRKRKTLI